MCGPALRCSSGAHEPIKSASFTERAGRLLRMQKTHRKGTRNGWRRQTSRQTTGHRPSDSTPRMQDARWGASATESGPSATSGEREKAAAVGAAAPIFRQEIVLAPVRGHRPSPFDAAVHSSSVRLSFKRTANGNGSVEKLQRVQRLWALPSSGFRQKKRFYRSTLQERYIRVPGEV
jgi:hypothetical protein